MGDIDWQHYLFQFDGRINRAKWWLGVVILWGVQAVLYGVFGGSDGNLGIVGIVGLLLLWPTLAIYIKRWHDRDKSGWWTLILFIPIIGFIWGLIELGMLEGTKGPNQYGPDPLGAAAGGMGEGTGDTPEM